MYVKKKREVATLREQKSTLLADWRKKKLKIYPPQKKKKKEPGPQSGITWLSKTTLAGLFGFQKRTILHLQNTTFN